MANSKFNSSISIHNATKEKLGKFRDKMELRTYDEAINELMDAKQGYISNDYEIIHKPEVALNLKSSIILDNTNEPIENTVFDEVPIYYDDLKESEIGKVYSTRKPASENYIVETATIVYKTDKLILLAVNEFVNFGEIRTFNHLIGVEYF